MWYVGRYGTYRYTYVGQLGTFVDLSKSIDLHRKPVRLLPNVNLVHAFAATEICKIFTLGLRKLCDMY